MLQVISMIIRHCGQSTHVVLLNRKLCLLVSTLSHRISQARRRVPRDCGMASELPASKGVSMMPIPPVRRCSDIPPEPTRLRRSDAATALKGGEAVSRREIGAKRKPLNALGSVVAILLTGSGRILFSFSVCILSFCCCCRDGRGCRATRSVVHIPSRLNYRNKYR